MANSFSSLPTENFRLKMRPHAIKIYETIFPGCSIQELRKDGQDVHVLDKEFAIDCLLILKGGQWISLQEKYRNNRYLKNGDFTQEYKNAVGTEYEGNGEWFKLGAQLYFYGWANQLETDFQKWVLLNIPKYKWIVEKSGGIESMGKLMQNNTHGRASFYCIPLDRIEEAIIADSESLEINKRNESLNFLNLTQGSLDL